MNNITMQADEIQDQMQAEPQAKPQVKIQAEFLDPKNSESFPSEYFSIAELLGQSKTQDEIQAKPQDEIQAEFSVENSESSHSEYFSIADLEKQEYDPCASPTILDSLIDVCIDGKLNLVRTFPLEHVTVECVMHAMRNRHVDIVEYFLNDAVIPLFKEACSWAAELGSLALMQWLIKAGCTPTINTFVCAAIHGDIGMLEYLHTFNIASTVRDHPIIIIKAAEHGSYQAILWLVHHGYKVDPHIGLVATYPHHINIPEYDRLMMLMWLYESGLYTPEHDSYIIREQVWADVDRTQLVSLIYNACNNYDVGILRWAVHKGFEFDLNNLYLILRSNIRSDHRYLAMDSYVSNVLEHDLEALGRPQKYDRKKAEGIRAKKSGSTL